MSRRSPQLQYFFQSSAFIVLLVSNVAVSALTVAETDHLMQRAAFSSEPWRFEVFASLSRELAVERLLSETEQGRFPELPNWAKPVWNPNSWFIDPPHEDPVVVLRKRRSQARAWLLEALVSDAAPLRARMVWFWHEFYAAPDLRHAASGMRRDQAWFETALGDYRHLAVDFTRSGTTVETLSLRANHANGINENFARELLELYSLGSGHYSETDIREVARAFTGWDVHRRSGVFVIRWHKHDFGVKELFGHNGRLDGDDVLEILFQHPRFAEFLMERMWTTFISPNSDVAIVKQWAAGFRDNAYSVKWALRTVLTSKEFWDEMGRKSLVRSPTELVLGEVRRRGLNDVPGEWLHHWCASMGQQPWRAPDVKGWRGHLSWLSVASLAPRMAFLDGINNGFTANSGAGPNMNSGVSADAAVAGMLAASKFDGTDAEDKYRAFNQTSEHVWDQIQRNMTEQTGVLPIPSGSGVNLK